MPLLRLLTVAALAGALLACGSDTAPSPVTGDARAAAREPAAAAPAGPAGLVIHLAPGGTKPDQFCIPEWSIANTTGQDVGALLVHLQWETRDGTVLEARREFGSLVEPLPAGKAKTLTLNGYTAACEQLRLVVTGYACRDANAVRMACPGPLRAEAEGEGGAEVDLSQAQEGPMKGAVEAP